MWKRPLENDYRTSSGEATYESVAGWWKRLLENRYRISTQLYIAIGSSVALTIAASLVGWFSFNQVGNAQSRVNDDSIPQLVAAFGVAQYGGALVGAGPSLAAATPDDFERISGEITEAHNAFEAELAALQQSVDGGDFDDDVGGDPEAGQALSANARFDGIRAGADTLIFNIDSIKSSQQELYQLNDYRALLQAEFDEINARLDRLVAPALDDQFFYTLTGYRELGQPPLPRSEHFAEGELERYRHLSELQSDIAFASQLIASAFTASDAATLEPLRERFEAAAERIRRKLTVLDAGQSAASQNGAAGFQNTSTTQIFPLVNRMLELGIGEQGVFDLIPHQLRLEGRQQGLLLQNDVIAVGLITEVDTLVNDARAEARAVTQASTQAIFTGRTLLLAISALSIGCAVLIAWLFVGRVLLRRLEMLSDWMRRMAGGDLEAQVEIGGRDEVADMAAALEIFRLHALEVQRLNLVEKLAEELQGKNDELESVLGDLRLAQDQIVMREKLAALGQLTAGVAHEIRNPLNFVKNFSESSQDLLEELKEVMDESAEDINEDQRSYIDEISQDLADNMERIRSHGNRADRIVHDMLMMGRDSGEWQFTNINNLVDEHARLAFHSARALDANFQLDLRNNLDEDMGEVEVIPQDLGRVVLNMVSNACYATDEKRRNIEEAESGEAYTPALLVSTIRNDENFEIHIKDNGSGIPEDVVDKIFNPFFTTKPTNQGTGLGLAMCNDIVRRHGGSISVTTEPGEFTEMIIELPLTPHEAETAEQAEEEDALIF